MNILAIETSCDETAAAVYSTIKGIQSNSIFSQIDLHKEFGGVVPEIASRSHIEKITSITANALKEAVCTLHNIDVLAVTNRPGLPGSLLIGVCFTKAMAWALQKPIIGINHLEGHIFSPFLEYSVPFPHLALTASGGHTALYLVHDFGAYDLLGHTLDDAAGEAFDKIAKVLGLPYPGGPFIEKLAQKVDFIDFFFYPRGTVSGLNFSFSGLKTAILYDLADKNFFDLQTKQPSTQIPEHIKNEIASSLLVCIKDIFITKLSQALALYPQAQAITFAGGVACNTYIRNQIQEFAAKNNLPFFVPSKQYCTDNAAMIAFVAAYKAEKNQFDNYLLDINPR